MKEIDMSEMVRFENRKDESVSVRKMQGRKPDGMEVFDWFTVNPGEVIELPRRYGKAKGLIEVSEKAEKLKETGNKALAVYTNKIISTRGIRGKIARDLTEIFPTEADLVKALKNDEHIPIDDNLIQPLKNTFLKPKKGKKGR